MGAVGSVGRNIAWLQPESVLRFNDQGGGTRGNLHYAAGRLAIGLLRRDDDEIARIRQRHLGGELSRRRFLQGLSAGTIATIVAGSERFPGVALAPPFRRAGS